jgi:hypothetical protein
MKDDGLSLLALFLEGTLLDGLCCRKGFRLRLLPLLLSCRNTKYEVVSIRKLASHSIEQHASGQPNA